MYTVPTGFILLPPLGPAKPVMARPKFVLAKVLVLLAIRAVVFSDMAPKRLMTFLLIFSIFDLASLEYSTRPNLKYFELPLMFVKA